MIDRQKICDYLITAEKISNEQIAACKVLIDKEIKIMNDCLCDDSFSNDERIIVYIAKKIKYEIAVSTLSEDSVVSFQAGDIKINESKDYLIYLKQSVEQARNDCRGLIIDDSFAFLGV